MLIIIGIGIVALLIYIIKNTPCEIHGYDKYNAEIDKKYNFYRGR